MIKTELTTNQYRICFSMEGQNDFDIRALKTYYYIDEIRAVASCSGNSCWLYDKDEGWIKVHAGLVQDYQYHVKEEDREV